MKVFLKLGFLVLASGMGLAQSNPPSNSTLAGELQALREAIAAQQAQIAEQQQRLAQQQKQIENLQQALEAKNTPHVENAALVTTAPNTAPAVQANMDKPRESPLSFRIGGTEFTPGGFVEFETVFRTTNTGSNIATSFGAIPFSNTVQGHLTELRMTGQYSRYILKISGTYGANEIVGYLEGDFNGNDAANAFVTSNPHTSRVRVYWADIKRGKWELLAGQSWGWVTPNRVGLSPMPADLALTYGEDVNVHVGIPSTRADSVHAVFHHDDKFQIGLSLENPEQFVGVGETIFPFAFNAQLGSQFDAANNTATPNAFPDFIPKMAYDTNFGNGQHFHVELGGLLTNVKVTNIHIGAPGSPFVHHSAIGGSGFGAFNVDVVKGFRVLVNGLWGAGNGRYILGLGPQAVVRPIQNDSTTFDVEPSMVHSGTALVGIEINPPQATKSQFGIYYGGAYFQRNAFPDVTSPLTVKPIIGFGGLNSPNSANRALQEASFDWTQTMWKNPQYGAVMLVTQTSYLTRSPWFVAAGEPKNAHLGMGYVSLRYVLP